MQSEEHILAIDLGTTKVCAVVARVLPNDELEVIGIGTHPSDGMQKGSVIDLERTARAIESASQKAMATAGVDIHRAWLGIAAGFVRSYNHRGSVAVLQNQRGITRNDMRAAMRSVVDKKIPAEMEVMHVIPRSYQVDETTGVRDPEGMHGGFLGVDVHLVCGRKNDLSNIQRAAQAAGLKVEGVILQPIASARSVLSEHEMDAGVAMIDIGGGTSDIAVYKEGQILQSKIVLIGGDLITRDIQSYFGTTFQHAEAIKKNYGYASVQEFDQDERLEIQRIHPRPAVRVHPDQLNFVIEARVEQICAQIERVVNEVIPLESLVAGLVLTGGSSLLNGVASKFQKFLGVETTLGIPSGVSGFSDVVKSPTCATAVGMLQYALSERRRIQEEQGRGVQWFVRKVEKFFKEHF